MPPLKLDPVTVLVGYGLSIIALALFFRLLKSVILGAALKEERFDKDRMSEEWREEAECWDVRHRR